MCVDDDSDPSCGLSRTKPLTFHMRDRLGELSGDEFEDEATLTLVASDWLESDSSNSAVDANDDIEIDESEVACVTADSECCLPKVAAGCLLGVDDSFGGGVGNPIGRSSLAASSASSSSSFSSRRTKGVTPC